MDPRREALALRFTRERKPVDALALYRQRVRVPLVLVLAIAFACTTVHVRYVKRGGPDLVEERGHCAEVMEQPDVKECTDGERINHTLRTLAIAGGVVGSVVVVVVLGFFIFVGASFGRG